MVPTFFNLYLPSFLHICLSFIHIFISSSFISPAVSLSLSLLWHCLLSTSSQSSILIPSQLCCTHLFLPDFFVLFGDSISTPPSFDFFLSLPSSCQRQLYRAELCQQYCSHSLGCLLIHSGPITDHLTWGGNLQYTLSLISEGSFQHLWTYGWSILFQCQYRSRMWLYWIDPTGLTPMKLLFNSIKCDYLFCYRTKCNVNWEWSATVSHDFDHEVGVLSRLSRFYLKPPSSC